MNNSIRQISQVFVGSAIALSTFSIQPVIGASLYNQIFIFGDSLSDPGNLFNLSGGTNPPPVFFEGRFSNGPVWSEHFAEALGLEPELWIKSPDQKIQVIPSDGINFAIAGAKTDDTHISGNPLPGLRNQVDYFVNDLLGQGNTLNNPLGVLMAGANDYFGGQSDLTIPIGNLSTEIQRLSDAGLKNILVSNLPDLGKIPLARSFGQPASENFTALTIAHNSLLQNSLNNLSQSNPDTNLILFDFFSLFNNILANPSEFGFTNITDSCTNINLILPPDQWLPSEDPPYLNGCSKELQDQFLFFDNQHPTTEAHRFIAAEALRTVSTPEPTIIPALGFLGMGLLALKGRPKKKEEKMVVAK